MNLQWKLTFDLTPGLLIGWELKCLCEHSSLKFSHFRMLEFSKLCGVQCRNAVGCHHADSGSFSAGGNQQTV